MEINEDAAGKVNDRERIQTHRAQKKARELHWNEWIDSTNRSQDKRQVQSAEDRF